MTPRSTLAVPFAAFVVLALCSCADGDPPNSDADIGHAADADTPTPDTDFTPDADAAEIVPDSAVADMGPDAPVSGWASIPALAAGPRQETAAVTLDRRIWVLGGFDGGLQMSSLVESYDPATRTWARHADFPVRAHHMNATVVDGEIWVTGFLVAGFAADERSFVYDPQSDVWRPGPSLPTGRQRGSSAVATIGGKIYVAGGLRGAAVVDFDVLDPATEQWTELPDLPRAVDHAAFGAIGGVLIVASGRSGSIASFTEQVDLFDPAGAIWTSGAPIPTPRGGVASAVFADRLWVFGGEGNPDAGTQGVFSSVESYDPALDAWQVHEPMPTPRHGLAAASIDGVIYLPGGATQEAFGAVDHSDSYTPE